MRKSEARSNIHRFPLNCSAAAVQFDIFPRKGSPERSTSERKLAITSTSPGAPVNRLRCCPVHPGTSQSMALATVSGGSSPPHSARYQRAYAGEVTSQIVQNEQSSSKLFRSRATLIPWRTSPCAHAKPSREIAKRNPSPSSAGITLSPRRIKNRSLGFSIVAISYPLLYRTDGVGTL